MAHEPLAGPIWKVERAKTQIEELDAFIAAFFNGHPHEVVSKMNAKATEETWQFRLKDGFIPTDIPGRIGEILHNLRSSLDQMACAIAFQHSGTTDGTYFPFGKTAQIFEGELARKGKNLPPDARAMIRALKPYNAGNKLLWAFHDFNRADKHVDVVAINATVTFDMSSLMVRSGQVIRVGPARGRHFVYDATTGNLIQPNERLQPVLVMVAENVNRIAFHVARRPPYKDMEFLTAKPGTKFEADFQPTFAIAFAKIAGFEREPVVAVLHQMRDLTERILLTFKSRFFP